MADDLPDLLASLRTGPVPPLAPSALVKARGEQRRRRTRTASGAAALALVLGGAGIASAVVDRDDRATLRPAATLDPTTAPVADLLLSLDTIQRTEPGNWQSPDTAAALPLLDPCPGGTDYPRDADRVDTATTSYQWSREGGGASVDQTVARYRDEATAADAAAGYERAVTRCPGSLGTGGQRSFAVVSTTDTDGAQTRVIRAASGCDVCYASYYAVQQLGDLVSVLSMAHGEDGDPGIASIEPYLPEVVTSLRHPTVRPATDWPRPVSLDSASEVWAVYVDLRATPSAGYEPPADANVRAVAHGYLLSSGDIACDRGAPEAFDTASTGMSGTAVHFASETDARAFADSWSKDGGTVVHTAEGAVTFSTRMGCND